MFRTLARLLLPNPLDSMLRKCARKKGTRILVAWNRGLGDIALGLFAIVKRIYDFIPDAKVTFVTREGLRDGFTFLEGVDTVVVPQWKRGEALPKGFATAGYDLVIKKPSPTDWVSWQRGKVVPLLKWNSVHDTLHEKFAMSSRFTYVGVQVQTETNYGFWRNWPWERWNQLFSLLESYKDVRVVLFGMEKKEEFLQSNIIDLRGKTNLFELLSIIKSKCSVLVVPDSGIASFAYYLHASFPIRLITLWADPNHGILKQNVSSPNPQLIHSPLIGQNRDLSTITAQMVVNQIFTIKPLQNCVHIDQLPKGGKTKYGSIILAGGQGSRLGFSGPKGLFPIAGKPVFQWLCEQFPKQNTPLAIMTSSLNHEATVRYFEKNKYFGLDIHFFQQEELPLLDERKQELSSKGPNGNGSVFRSFVKAGLDGVFQQKGIALVTVVQVDNIFSLPCDDRFIAHAQGADVALQCVRRKATDKNMGAIVERGGKVGILEYTMLDPKQEYLFSNISHFAFSLSFMQKMAHVELPLHWVKKKAQIGANTLDVWKREQYIFDALDFATEIRAVCVDREKAYAALKSRDNIVEIEHMLRNQV